MQAAKKKLKKEIKALKSKHVVELQRFTLHYLGL